MIYFKELPYIGQKIRNVFSDEIRTIMFKDENNYTLDDETVIPISTSKKNWTPKLSKEQKISNLQTSREIRTSDNTLSIRRDDVNDDNFIERALLYSDISSTSYDSSSSSSSSYSSDYKFIMFFKY